MSAGPAASGAAAPDFPELFEGPEKSLTLRFRARRLGPPSLRLLPREAWERVLRLAGCEILSAAESTPAVLSKKSAGRRSERASSTRGVTAYLLSESSLCVFDAGLTLKTCGRTTPLAAIEAILDLAVPSWRDEDADAYLKYALFTHLGFMRPDEQPEPHASWPDEVSYLEKYFRGESVVLGSQATSLQHVYVANYLPRDEIVDVFSTQVALAELDTDESMRRFGGGRGRAEGADALPLRAAWGKLHGDGPSVASDPVLDECFFEPIGYSSNGVFGKHFTTIHVTPQPGCSYASVETTMPMHQQARSRFVTAAADFCRAGTLALTEFALSSALFAGRAAPEVPGFLLERSSQSVGAAFACAHHHYSRVGGLGPAGFSSSPAGAPTEQHPSESEDGAAPAGQQYPAPSEPEPSYARG